MKFTDLIALAKQGYSPKDIKDLLALAEPEPEDPKDTEPEDPKDTEPEQKDPKDPEPVVPEDKKPPEQQKDDTDYKKLYTDLLKETQERNRRQNMQPEEKPIEEKMADIFRGML